MAPNSPMFSDNRSPTGQPTLLYCFCMDSAFLGSKISFFLRHSIHCWKLKSAFETFKIMGKDWCLSEVSVYSKPKVNFLIHHIVSELTSIRQILLTCET